MIASWNSPVALVIRSLAPALAAGTTAVVMLPAQSAQTSHLMSEIISDVEDLPAGVVNMIIGNSKAGNELVVSPQVPVISFTGGTTTGRTITGNAAPYLKRLGLELGDKTPVIILDDADIDDAVAKTIQALIVFAGQFCMTGSRVLVQKKVADAVRSALVEKLGAVKLGPASDSSVEMGPVIDKKNVERIDGMVQKAITDGAVALLRGARLPTDLSAKALSTVPRCSKRPTQRWRLCRRRCLAQC